MHPTHFEQQIFGSLLIGAEVFAIAALWPVSEWAVVARRPAGFVAALAVIVACIALDTHGLDTRAIQQSAWGRALVQVLGGVTLPLFIAFPDAICVASAQSLTMAGVSVRVARGVSLFLAALAVIAAPFATLMAVCGLSGTCF